MAVAVISCFQQQDTLHRGEGKAVLVTSQFSHNLPVSLNNKNTAKNLKLTQVEHACSAQSTGWVCRHKIQLWREIQKSRLASLVRCFSSLLFGSFFLFLHLPPTKQNRQAPSSPLLLAVTEILVWRFGHGIYIAVSSCAIASKRSKGTEPTNTAGEMAVNTTGETFQERSKGKDVRTSNIVAAKVSRNSIGRYPKRMQRAFEN